MAELQRLTGISPWFLQEMEGIVILEGRLRGFNLERLPEDLLEKAKRAGFSDAQIASFCATTAGDVAARRICAGLHPAVKRVDTCAGEFQAETPYLYQTWEQFSEAPPTDRPKAIVLGSGP
ncbi:MAG: hypothetical protein IPN59_08565 [Holophaga sp.]|nr:hypothetical protein [Holophaga sp.]